MESPTYIALSRQSALRRQLDVVAHNVANMNTPAFKAQRVLFQEFLAKTAFGKELSMAQDFATLRDTRPGPLTRTGNPLDLALHGNGYFVVETLDGPRYTRAGAFQLDAERQLVDRNGLPVLDENDRPIVVPEGALEITVQDNGTIATENGPVARLKLVTFADEQRLRELGADLYVTDQEPQAADETVRVVQGMLEESNVQPIAEMTRMIEIQRQYASTQRLIETEHERQRQAITKLARVS